ncbi:putative porin [Flavobacterium sp. SUN052]|uniref:putative porin n=1 Tax=Flavobacterium sp. SUN052 TaxID=3002441 RepID=UPI00237DC3DF|nr:putative porin [Flavobacterium sp. SUN052]MEC4004779.1 putative porin [Flavobacterium sp. SUN052]
MSIYSQEKGKESQRKSLVKTAEQKAKELAKKAPITSYKIISLQRDTIVLDTTLSIKKEYDYNYLRKDIFGLMPFPNEGQTYTTLNFGLNKFTSFPEFGFKAKHFNYLEVNDIKYYSVATPLTELYFKTVMEQGQNVDALITLNTAKNFNFSIAFKGLRSLGKYINQLSSNGNFRFTTSYFTLNNRYALNFHYTGQDLLNGENGGLTMPEDFENEDPAFKNRPRLQVYLTNAKSFLKGKRFFFDHSFRINTKDASNNLFITHQFNYEHKFFEFNQVTTTSTIGTNTTPFYRFGDTSQTTNIIDQTIYDRLYNKVGLIYENKTIGKFQFFIENFNYKYFYNTEKTIATTTFPNQLKATINTVGGQYDYRKKKWNGTIVASNSISTQPTRNFDAKLTYTINPKNSISFQYQNISKLPNHNYNLNQSSYNEYNWYHNFRNEKINNLVVNANTQWLSASLQVTSLNDHLYFKDSIPNSQQQYVKPEQFNGTINYISLKLAKEIKYRKWALDNTFLYQKVAKKDTILNVPELTLRNTIYYSDYVFKRAMFLQTGIIVNYFTKYYADDYNPILGEFFVQKTKQIGEFPMLDFFVNARVKQTRIYLKAEHFNSGFSGSKYYSAPNLPYHDFMIRFGLVWNFFQ